MDESAQKQHQWIEASYRLRAENLSQAQALAKAIAYEQTVELPPEQITDPRLLRDVVAQVKAVEQDRDEPGAWRAEIHYNADLANQQLSQLFNLVYANVSMYFGVRLMDLVLPPDLLRCFTGPRFGIEGLRQLLNVPRRPLLCTVVKPRGLQLDQMTRLLTSFVDGGGDIIKDDQNLFDLKMSAFEERVGRCAEALDTANLRRGDQPCLYFPHLAGPDEELVERARIIRSFGLKGALFCPLILGLDRSRRLAQESGLALMAHPAYTGSYTNRRHDGIEHGVLMGTFFRLMGADIVAATGFGGRFAYTQRQCDGMVAAMTQPLGDLAPALPAPAGGMYLDGITRLVERYGKDLMMLVGGDLLGRSCGVTDSTQAFVSTLEQA